LISSWLTPIFYSPIDFALANYGSNPQDVGIRNNSIIHLANVPQWAAKNPTTGAASKKNGYGKEHVYEAQVCHHIPVDQAHIVMFGFSFLPHL
jgi:hypothetical protein